MAKRMVELRNLVGVPQKIWIGTDEYIIPPYETSTFEEDVAAEFLKECPGFVTEFKIQEVKGSPGEEIVWIANGTGNPFLAKTVLVPGEKPDSPPVQLPHPNREAITLHWDIKAPEVRGKDMAGHEVGWHHVGTHLALPPYQRVPVPRSIALWLIQRDDLQTSPFRKGKVVYARAPGEFEPNRLWSLDDMILWASMVDGAFFNVERIGKEFHPEVTYNGDQNKIRSAKTELWTYVFHMLIDKQRNIPPRAVFEQKKQKLATEFKKKA